MSSKPTKKERLYQAIKEGKVKDATSASVFGMIDDLNTRLDDEVPALKDILAKIKGDKGDQGDKGEKGDKGDSVQGRDGKDGKDGKDGQTPSINTSEIALEASNRAMEAIKPLIPTIEAIEKNIPMLGHEIRDSLELLTGDERLDYTAIKGLEEKLAESKKIVGGGSTARNFYQLFDVPQSYAGQSGKVLSVKSTEDGLEFTTGGGGYTNLTEFVAQTAWRVFYSDGSGDVKELALGADGTFLKSNGASSAPTFATPAGTGDVVKVGTPVDNQIGVWTGDGTIEGDAALTFDTSTNTLVIGSGVLTVDTLTLTGTGTLNGVDAIDATTEATIEAAIDTLANLVSIQSLTVTLADAGADALLGWDDSASAYQNLSAADALAATGGAAAATTITIAGTAGQITSSAGAQSLAANRTWTLSLPSDVLIPTVLTVPNSGLHILDTNASHDLIITPGSDLTADRVLTITTGDAARTVTLSGNPTLADWFDQAVKTTSNPTFGNLTITSFAANWTNAGRTVADLGIVTTIDLNGGTIDGTTIGTSTVSGALTLAENASIALDPAGSADGKYTGITVTGTGGATIAFGDLVTLDKDDSRWELVDISVAAAATGDARGIIGIAVTSSTDGGALTILLHGIIRADANFPALTIGAAVYASTTGDIVVTQPTTTDHVIRVVGYALTADEIYFNPENDWITHT